MSKNPSNKSRIGEIAKETGLPRSTIRYYTTLGLFKLKGKTPGGQALYDPNDTKNRFATIKKLKEKRWTIKEILADFKARRK